MTGFLSPSPKTKKELKTLVGQRVYCFIPTPFYCDEVKDGKIPIVGPDPFKKRTWYSTITLENGILQKVE